VVATEVRRLAERSRGATAEITRIVQDVQRAARESLAVVAESRQRAQDAAALAADSGGAIRRLAVAIDASSAAANRIAGVTIDQGAAVDQLWGAFRAAFEATRENAEGVVRLREASRAIAGRADHMRSLVERYELPEDASREPPHHPQRSPFVCSRR
jgi:methyl-accepting chemotaxis protein